MAKAQVYLNQTLAGFLEKKGPASYHFIYEDRYYIDPKMPPVSLTLPKTQKEYQSPVLFSFFAGLLAEGINKKMQCMLLKIDEQDDFTRLLRTAGYDPIGAVTVKEM